MAVVQGLEDYENIKEELAFVKAITQGIIEIKEGVPQIGQGFVTAIVEHIETLSAHPDIGRVALEFNDELIRELIHAPFRIVYLRESLSSSTRKCYGFKNERGFCHQRET